MVHQNTTPYKRAARAFLSCCATMGRAQCVPHVQSMHTLTHGFPLMRPVMKCTSGLQHQPSTEYLGRPGAFKIKKTSQTNRAHHSKTPKIQAPHSTENGDTRIPVWVAHLNPQTSEQHTNGSTPARLQGHHALHSQRHRPGHHDVMAGWASVSKEYLHLSCIQLLLPKPAVQRKP